MRTQGPSDGRRRGMTLRAPRDFSLRETVLAHGGYQLPPFHWEPASESLTRAEILSRNRPGVLRLRQRGGLGGRLQLDFGGDSLTRLEALRAAGRVRRMLSLDFDIGGFLDLCRTESRLRYVPRVGAGRLLSSGEVYEDVFKGICGTNIGWRQAVVALHRVATSLGEETRFGFRTFPAPGAILGAGARRLSEISRLGYRVPFLLEWARRVSEEEPVWRAAQDGRLNREELRDFFLSIRGVGKATADFLLMVSGFPQEIPVDSSVILYCRLNRFRGRTPSENQVRRLYDRFGSWKALAYWFEFLPWASEHWGFQGAIAGDKRNEQDR